jgi:hypothetical protein
VGGAIETPRPVRLAQALFYLNAIIWLLFGVMSLFRMADRNPESSVTLTILAILMFVNVGAMLFCALTIGKGRKWFYFLALAVLALNIVLSITDEFGFFDFLVLALDVLLLGLLISHRKSFLAASIEPSRQS